MLTHSFSDATNSKSRSYYENVVLLKPIFNETENLLKKHWLQTLSPWIAHHNMKQEVVYIFGFGILLLLIIMVLTVVPFLLNAISPLFFISSIYYWLALLTRKKLSSNKLYIVLWANLFSELLNNCLTNGHISFFAFNQSSVDIRSVSVQFSSFIICGSIIALLLFLFGFTFKFATIILLISQFVRILSTTCSIKIANSPVRPFLTLIFGLIGIIVARSTESVLSPVISTLITPDSRMVAWRRRRSSNALLNVPRRTSLPALGANRISSYHGNYASITSVDGAILAEAHGLVTDMLTDSQLPPHILSGLRAVASLLSPPSMSMSPRTKPAGISISLVDFNNSGSDSEESPYIGERTSNLPKRGKRSLPPSLLRRMSTSTWTTTTSATGMPTLEPEPSRKRSTSFRSLAQSPISATAPPLTSPVTIPLKGRSYSTTALPFGALAALQNYRERQFFYNTNINEIGSTYRRAEFEEGEADNETTEDEGNETISIPTNTILNIQRKQFSPRLNLTSDYDSSNESPSGSDATLDESVSLDSSSRSVLSKKSPNISSEIKLESLRKKSISYKDDESYRENKCVLCGTKSKIYAPTDKSPVHQLNWPFSAPLPPLVPQLDKNGHYVIDGTIYDLEELSTLPLLCRINEWDYPIFELAAQTGDAILSKMSYHVFLEAGLMEAFKIPIPEFLNYFRALEKGYRNKPYHNRMHAADVLQGVYYLTSQPIPGFAQIPADSTDSPLHKTSIGPLPQSYVKHMTVCDETYGIIGANYPALELMALYTAAAMHDFDHPGRTNAFLVTTYASQAILYNDRSVLENHHAAAAWSLLLSKPEYNWLRHLDKAEFKRFRFLVIEFILATDLKRHFEILAEFNAKVNEDDATGIDWFLETDRLLVMEMAIKFSDINGPCKTFEIHRQWTYRIAEEFYEQGDEEERLGLPISPYMDRKNPQLAKLQESFINHLVAPLCNAYGEAGLLPGVWEYQESVSSEDGDLSDDGSRSDPDFILKLGMDKTKMRKVSCLQTKHLQENYEIWINVLKEKRSSHQQSPNISSDDSSTPVLTQQALEEIIEAEESQGSNYSSGCESNLVSETKT